MKTYVLDQISSQAAAAVLLSSLLPNRTAPWLLLAESGDPIAYFDLVPSDIDIVAPSVTADVSGRHYNEDRMVLDVLEKLQRVLGGIITFDSTDNDANPSGAVPCRGGQREELVEHFTAK